MEKICTHIIIRDKFTKGYIDFFDTYDFGWEHYFITFNGDYQLSPSNKHAIYIVKNYKEILKNYSDLLFKSDKIVVASFFDNALHLLKMNNKLWSKTYIQFWGGDIYRFNNIRKGPIQRLKQIIVQKLTTKGIKKAKGILTLVKGDYDSIEKIFHVSNLNHFTVQVPDDFYIINHLDYSIFSKHNNSQHKKILVGNSATQDNMHEEIINILCEKSNISDYEFIFPLSYGDEIYKQKIIKLGVQKLGKSFMPITNFMPRNDYIRLLSTCDTAIFNNNRQQATGNIILLANLHKKIYLRSDTTMWSFFNNLGFSVYNVNKLYDESLKEITNNSQDSINKNNEALLKMEKEAIDQWDRFINE